MEKYTCPCCGYKTLHSKHDYDICPICFWEDDSIQFDDIDCAGGANDISLRQAQKNYIKFGACQRDMLKHVRKPNKNDIKDSSWEPISNK